MVAEHRWMTTDEVARRMGVSASTVRRRLQERQLPGRRVGKRWLVPQAALADLTAEQAAELLRAHPDTVRRWLAEGRLPGRRAGRRWLVSHNDLVRFVEGAER